MDALLRRVLEGRHTIIVGGNGVVQLESPPGLGRLDVDCRRYPRPLEPLLAIERQARQALGPSTLPPEDYALGHRAFGDSADRAVVRDCVNDLNRLARMNDTPLVVVLHAIQLAHPSTLRALARLAVRGACNVPLVFGVDRAEGEAVQALVEAVSQVEGAGAVVRVEPLAQGEPPARDAGQAPELDVTGLPADVRRILRAGAVLGSPFEVALLAHLTRSSEIDVLEALQRAADQGIPIDDLGDGRVSLPEALAARLAAETLPSLERAWNARAARILADAGRPPWPEAAGARQGAQSEASAGERRQSTPPPEPDAARAAGHAARAGDVEQAVQQQVQAARRATDLGGYEEALDRIARGQETLGSMPHGPVRRRLRIALDTQLARVHWLAASSGDAFSLTSALDALGHAEQLLDANDPPALGAEVRRVIAGVRYDMGDPESLEIALSALTTAEHALIEAGEHFDAARLLGDEAAIWLRIGDPVRAGHLLERAREVFHSIEPRTDETRRALADTDHLIAKLVLHASPRPGKETEAVARGLELATSARDVYRQLGLRTDTARVEETLGRLHHRAGKLEEAVRHLAVAARTQQALGDAMGLARSSEALAEMLAEAGDADSALDLLKRSIAINLQKASPAGAAFNREGVALLLRYLAEERRQDLAPVLGRLDELLRQATDEPRGGAPAREVSHAP